MHASRQRGFGASLAPPTLDQLGWIGIELATPMHHSAFVVGDVEIQLGMRVGIVELRDHALHGDGVTGVIRDTSAMMRGNRNHRRDDTQDQYRKTRWSTVFHCYSLRWGDPSILSSTVLSSMSAIVKIC